MNGDWGKTLRTYRSQTRIKQQGLATKLGVSQGYISRLESGQVEPPDELIEKIKALAAAPESITLLDQLKTAVRRSPTPVSLVEICSEFRLAAISDACRDRVTPFASFAEGAPLKSEGFDEFKRGLELARTSLLQDDDVQPTELVWTMSDVPNSAYIRTVIVPMMISPGQWYLHLTSVRISTDAYLHLKSSWRGTSNRGSAQHCDCCSAHKPDFLALPTGARPTSDEPSD